MLGAIALVGLAIVFRDELGNGLQHRWWGILGKIGWAYFFVSLLNLFFGPRREWLLAGAAVMMASYFADKARLFVRVDDKTWLAPHYP